MLFDRKLDFGEKKGERELEGEAEKVGSDLRTMDDRSWIDFEGRKGA